MINTNIDLDQTITLRELIQHAQYLKSEDGENGEYDRALLELVTDAAHIPQNDRAILYKMIWEHQHDTPCRTLQRIPL